MSSLLPLSADEDALIRALRAQPDQSRHIVAVGDDPWDATVQHPVMERVTGDLFACPVLQTAIEAELPQGRWRLIADDGSFERVP